MSGNLIIQPLQAQLTHDLDTFTQMDPYWLITIGTQRHQGKVCKSGGKNPQWDDAMTISLQGEAEFFIELKDKDVISDDIIGVCQIPIQEIVSQQNVTQWYNLYCNQKSVGQILINVTHSQSQYQNQPQQLENPTQAYPGQVYVQPQSGYPQQQTYVQNTGSYQQQPQTTYQQQPQTTYQQQQQTYPQQTTTVSYGQQQGGYPQQTQQTYQQSYPQQTQSYPQQTYPQQTGGYVQQTGYTQQTQQTYTQQQNYPQQTTVVGMGQPTVVYTQPQGQQVSYPQQGVYTTNVSGGNYQGQGGFGNAHFPTTVLVQGGQGKKVKKIKNRTNYGGGRYSSSSSSSSSDSD